MYRMAKISLCMIVKNEADVLERCLSCVKNIADEIIIVDTGSADSTKQIAAKFTDKIYDFAWCDDFSKARNFALSYAVFEYVMWLDADDIILKDDEKAILELKNVLSGKEDTVFLKYVLSYDELGKPLYFYFRERIIKNCPQCVWVEPVHEVIVPFGNIIYSEAAISHKKEKYIKSDRNIRIIENYIKNGGTLSPRLNFYYARELNDHERIEDAIRVYNDFIDSSGGWSENKIEACLNLSRIYKKRNERDKEFTVLTKSFSFAAPKAAVACALGEWFLEKNDFKSAVFWFSTALSLRPETENLGFIERDYFEFIPCIWLSFCYDMLGKPELARSFNELAGRFKPNDASYLYNKKYFESKITIND